MCDKRFIPVVEAGSIVPADFTDLEARVIADELDQRMRHIRHMVAMGALNRAMSRDQMFAAAYGADRHRLRAAAVFGVPYDEVTPAQRRYGKTLNYIDHYTPRQEAKARVFMSTYGGAYGNARTQGR